MLTVEQRARHWPLTAAHLPVIYGSAARAAISAALFPRVPRAPSLSRRDRQPPRSLPATADKQ